MGANLGEFSDESEDDDPIPSLLVERLSCENMSRHTGESRLFVSGSCRSSRREELLPPNTVAPCWSSAGGDTRGETGVTFRLLRWRTGDWSTGE